MSLANAIDFKNSFAPEALQGEKIDPKSGIWMLGCTMSVFFTWNPILLLLTDVSSTDHCFYLTHTLRRPSRQQRRYLGSSRAYSLKVERQQRKIFCRQKGQVAA